jgi:signal transduction histidine kinase
MLQEVSGQLRGVTMQLHPPILADLGLALALDFLVEEAQRTASARVRLERETAEDGARAPADVELAAFRIAQEALTNAIRHSAARVIVVQALVRPAEVRVSITDDGVGLDRVATSEALVRGHVGLRSMSERAGVVGGELLIDDARPGTRVTFRWPA